MKTDAYERLQQYLLEHNITLQEFAEWSGIPVRALYARTAQWEQKIHVHILQRHPLATPRIPDDFGRRLDAWRVKHNLTWSQLAEQTGVHPRTLANWQQCHRPSLDAWRQFVQSGVYARVMQQIDELPQPPSFPARKFENYRDWIYHPSHGWCRKMARDGCWWRVHCPDGIERWFLARMPKTKKEKKEKSL